jgi:hypothetical protein
MKPKRVAFLVLVLAALAAWLGLTARVGASPRDEGQGHAVNLGGLESRAPADWKPQPAGQMRAYQFGIDNAQLVIFYFGPGGAGSADANVKRWKGMFNPPEGKSIDDVSKLDHFKVGDSAVTHLDLHGTYKFKARPFDPNAQEELKPNYRMIGVVFETPKGPYFMRFVGPDATVSKHKQEFDNWLKAFK